MCTSLLFINWISSTIHHFSSQRRFLNLPLSQIFNKMPTSYSFGRICQSWSKFWQLPVSIPFYLKFKRGRHLTNLLLIALIQRCNMQCRELQQNCKRCAWKGNCFSDWSSCCQDLTVKWHHFLLPASMLFSLKLRHYLADLLLIVLIQKCNMRCIHLNQKWKLLSRLIFSFSRTHLVFFSTHLFLEGKYRKFRIVLCNICNVWSSDRFECAWNEICFPDWSSLLSSDIIFSGAHLVFFSTHLFLEGK